MVPSVCFCRGQNLKERIWVWATNDIKFMRLISRSSWSEMTAGSWIHCLMVSMDQLIFFQLYDIESSLRSGFEPHLSQHSCHWSQAWPGLRSMHGHDRTSGFLAVLGSEPIIREQLHANSVELHHRALFSVSQSVTQVPITGIRVSRAWLETPFPNTVSTELLQATGPTTSHPEHDLCLRRTPSVHH